MPTLTVQETAPVLHLRDLYKLIERDYEAGCKKDLVNLRARWERRLEPFFGNPAVLEIKPDAILRYAMNRKEEGAANATINRELSSLKRGYKLAIRNGLLKFGDEPYIQMLRENNIRQGFVHDVEYEALARETGRIGMWLRTMFELAITYGWRRGELLDLKVEQVNLTERTISLNGSQTKNGKPRVVFMTEKVFKLLTQCVAGKSAEDHVFTRGSRLQSGCLFKYKASRFWWTQYWRDGKPVRESTKTESEEEARRILKGRVSSMSPIGAPVVEIRDDWKLAVQRAGCPRLMFHDLRRSAVRNMIRDGVRERVAMSVSGHITRSIFDRYNIVDLTELRDASTRMQKGAARRLRATKKQPQHERSSHGGKKRPA